MSLYGFILLIHLIAAVVGLGQTFALPAIMGSVKTKSQALWAFNLFNKIEKPAKISSITLLATGIVMGIIHTELFKEIWFIGSLVIYVGIQFIVAGILPKNMKKQLEVLENSDSDELPAEYIDIDTKMKPYNLTVHTSAVILIILMTVKPF